MRFVLIRSAKRNWVAQARFTLDVVQFSIVPGRHANGM